MNQILTYWPIVTGLVAIAGAISGFVVALLQIKQLRLSVEKLKKEVRESRESIYRPRIEEIEKYGKALEEIVREPERFYNKQVQLMEMSSEIAKEQIFVQKELSEKVRHLLLIFEEAENRTRNLCEQLIDVSKALNEFCQNHQTKMANKANQRVPRKPLRAFRVRLFPKRPRRR